MPGIAAIHLTYLRSSTPSRNYKKVKPQSSTCNERTVDYFVNYIYINIS